jgi:hypothetical protein
MTIAEKWADALNNVADSERDDVLAAMYEEHLDSYTSRDATQYLLFSDDSVYSDDDDCLTKAELLEGSEASPGCGISDIFDGVIRTFWPMVLPEIGDMRLLFDRQAFSIFAGDRTRFSFGAWHGCETAGHIEYTVSVLPLLDGKPAADEFTLHLSDQESSDECDVDYCVMPSPEPGASWNNPLRWQEVVDAMEYFCASIVCPKCLGRDQCDCGCA